MRAKHVVSVTETVLALLLRYFRVSYTSPSATNKSTFRPHKINADTKSSKIIATLMQLPSKRREQRWVDAPSIYWGAIVYFDILCLSPFGNQTEVSKRNQLILLFFALFEWFRFTKGEDEPFCLSDHTEGHYFSRAVTMKTSGVN
jgi:hypothetical protein